MGHIDARVRYTRMVIEQSFLGLLQEKPVSKITVTELCARAEINRATFYKHYQDVPQLFERMEEALLKQIRAGFDGFDGDFEAFLAEILHGACREREQLLLIGSENGDPRLMEKLFLLCRERGGLLLEQKLPGLDAASRSWLMYFVAGGSGAVLAGWVKEGMKETPEEMARLILRMTDAAAQAMK